MQLHRLAEIKTGSGGQTVLTVAGEPLFQLNSLATTIWTKLSAGLSIHEIAIQLASQFEVPEKRVRYDVLNFILLLRRHYLIEGYNLSTSEEQAPYPPESNGTSRPQIRSFDLFDTLIARRCVYPGKIFEQMEKRLSQPGFAMRRGRAESELAGTQYTLEDIYHRLNDQNAMAVELQIESENIFPIAEAVAEVQPNDVIVSDMYLPKDFLHSVAKQKAGLLLNPIVVTNKGKASGKVWEHLKEKVQIVEHVGDNPHSDLHVPKKLGIPARHTRISALSVEEETLYQDGFIGLAETIREARLTTFDADSMTRHFQILQMQLNFPLLFLSSIALHRKLEENGICNVLMSSRDCFLWHKLQDAVRAMLNGTYRVHYFFSSRLSKGFPSPSYLEYVNQFLTQPSCIVDVDGTGRSLSRLIQRSENPDTLIFLIAKLEDVHLDQWYSDMGKCREKAILHLSTEFDMSLERANLARHPMVKDVIDVMGAYLPVYSNTAELDWQGMPQIRIQHESFFYTLKMMQHNNLSGDLLIEDEIILKRIVWLAKRLMILDDWSKHLILDFQNREDVAVRRVWKQLRDQSNSEPVGEKGLALGPAQIFQSVRVNSNHPMHDSCPFLRKNAKGNILEIGIGDGASTAAFLLGIEENGGHLYSVDPEYNHGSLHSHPQWTFIHADDETAASVHSRFQSANLDILFINASLRSETLKEDLRHYAPLVKDGGIVLVHDISGKRDRSLSMVADGRHKDTPRQEYENFAAEMGWSRFELPGLYAMGVLFGQTII